MKAERSENKPAPSAEWQADGIGAGYIRVKRRGRAGRTKRSLILYLLLIGFAAGFVTLFIHGNYARRIFVKLGLVPGEGAYAQAADLRTVSSWDQCLEQLGVDADVVFFGDSLTHYSNFPGYFPELTICNFGVDSDTLAGMNQRVYMIKTVTPEKVFVLGGINSLSNDRFNTAVLEYERLLGHMDSVLDADIYVLSVLPIAKDREIGDSGNETITRFNEKLAQLAKARGMTYLDLAPLFLLDGEMNPDYTTDGVHLSPAGYDVWADAIEEYIR